MPKVICGGFKQGKKKCLFLGIDRYKRILLKQKYFHLLESVILRRGMIGVIDIKLVSYNRRTCVFYGINRIPDADTGSYGKNG